nr:PREDICTED: LOW QUALITY PROTEIN: activating signal cointegrator 1 complex subunit 2 [Anolis carolinensis]|eukprot:XP_008123716.1 PREDICTED: LOW QUALITY PROTEIN: activating signal cointegrator 1 complex subunit 2 [Anolis carolinensis]
MPALDELYLTEKDAATGTMKTLPALHPSQMSKERAFPQYRPPPPKGAWPSAEWEEFLARTASLADALDWLLALPHHRFWSQVVFDERLQKTLDAFLSSAPRKFDATATHDDEHVSPEVEAVQRRLHRGVFMTFLRMSTHKESPEHFLSPPAFGEIVYNHFLFDIPKIMDLCVLFGKGNGPLLHKMIQNVFAQQPSYFADLDESLPTVLQVFGSVLERCGLASASGEGTPQKLGERARPTPHDMPLQDLADIVRYVCDSCVTLWAFLEVFPLAANTFHKHDFCARLASFYELLVPELESAIKRRRHQDPRLLSDLWRRLSHSKRKIAELFHLLVQHLCLQPILENSAESIHPFVEEFLQIFASVLQERRFLCEYDSLFPVADDVSLLQQASPQLDETRTSYLLQAVKGARKEEKEEEGGSHAGRGGPRKTPAGGGLETAIPETAVEVPREEEESDLTGLVCQVKEVFPDLPEGFVECCLREHGRDVERVIHLLLEGKIPRPADPDPTPLLRSRHNVFQDDAFDVFSSDHVDLSRVQKGKRAEGRSTRLLLEDKRFLSGQRGRYEQYSLVAEEEEEVPAKAYDDDEYDDTYDGNQVGANDADSHDELLLRRPFTVPQVLRSRPNKGKEEEEEDEEEEEEEQEGPKDHFVQDPAVLRERAEARRMAFLARKGPRGDPSSSSSNGRGQSKAEAGPERRRKEAAKASRANHSRRLMSDRKRSKGMVPQ